MMNTLRRILAFACILGAPLLAQEAEQPEKKVEKGRRAWFVYTNFPEGLENPVTVMHGKDISKLLLSKLSPSDPVKVPADGILRVVRKIENPQEPDKPQFITLAQATVPEGVSDAIVILIPMVKSVNGLLFNTKVQDLAALKGGDTMFMNMTNLKIGVELGTAKVGIDPGQVKIHNPLGNAKALSLPIRISFFNTEKQEWSMITASTVALYSTRKEMCIFNWDSRFNRVDFESLTFPMIDPPL